MASFLAFTWLRRIADLNAVLLAELEGDVHTGNHEGPLRLYGSLRILNRFVKMNCMGNAADNLNVCADCDLRLQDFHSAFSRSANMASAAL